jgi:sec-independent protein translocase protein TatA
MQWTDILIILLVILVLFGAKKLPEIGKSLGEAVGQFKKGMSGEGGAKPGKKKSKR